MPELKLINFKATPDEIANWKGHARSGGRTLSAWIRSRLNAEGGTTYVRPPLPEYEPPLTRTETALTALEDVARKRKKGTCVNRLPKGSFCKRCGQTHG